MICPALLRAGVSSRTISRLFRWSVLLDTLGTCRRASWASENFPEGGLRRSLPGPLGFTFGTLGALLLREDAEVFLCGLLGHELPVVLEEHLGGVPRLQGDLSCRLGNGQPVRAEGVTEAIVDEGHQGLVLGVDQLGGGILEELGEVELVTDAGKDRTGLGSGLQPCLKCGNDGSQSPGGGLGLVLTDLNDPLIEPDVLPLQPEDLDGPETRKPSQSNEGDKPLLDVLQQSAELVGGVDPYIASLIIVAGGELRLSLLPSGEVLLIPRVGEEGQQGHPVVVLGTPRGLLHTREPLVDVISPDTPDLALKDPRGLLELRFEVEDVAARFGALDGLQKLGREFREGDRGEGTPAVFLFEMFCVELGGRNNGATP